MKRTKFIETKEAIKHPAKIVLAIVQDTNGKFNMITIEWFMRTSTNPPMFAISIGHSRYSHQCLQNIRFFNLSFPTAKMVKIAKFCGELSGRDCNKFAETKVKWFAGRLAKFPILKDAKANFECKVITQIKSGDHTIFVGEVKYSWLNEEGKVLTHKDF